MTDKEIQEAMMEGRNDYIAPRQIKGRMDDIPKIDKIEAAVAEEREACARILDQEAEREDELAGPTAYRVPSSRAQQLRGLANEIRGRSK